MPSQRIKHTDDLPDFDFFSTLGSDLQPAAEASKLHTKKKGKKKNNEAISVVAEQSDQEKAPEQPVSSKQSEVYVHGSPEPNPYQTSFVSQMAPPIDKNQNSYTSPVFAALGDAFRDKSTSAKHEQGQQHHQQQPQQGDEDDGLESYTRSPARQELISSSPPASRFPSVPYSIPSEVRGGFSPPAATSPRPAYRQLSRRPSGYAHQPDSVAISPRGRPVSMPAHMFQLSSPSGFNLNHMLRNSSRSTSRKGSKYTYTSLDSLSTTGDSATTSQNVLLAACESTLYVFHLGKEKASEIGKIVGLRGQVVSAKIIPSSSRKDSASQHKPLVAIIVHGVEEAGEDLSRPSSRHSDYSFNPSHPYEARTMPAVPKYQTTVEIWSLRLHMQVATLFASKAEEPRIENVFGKQSYEPPGPIGSLSVHLTNGYIAVVSNESGEIYLYDHHSGLSEQPFRCIGKTWTSVSVKKSRTWSSSSAPEPVASRDGSPTRQTYDAPLVAIAGRILVYVPPIASSKSTILGRVKIANRGHEVPGLASHTASSQPVTNTQLETPLDGSMVNEIARGVTQEMLKGASWVGNQGVQVWKNYWNPKSPEANSQTEHVFSNQFPPTHASDDPGRVAQQPTIVSFLDLDQLARSQKPRSEYALQPTHSVTLPGGCSFIHLSPTGLGLLTASAKGDVQNVWDLVEVVDPKKVTGGRAKNIKDHPAIIRQVARFTRITEANIVDAAWSSCHGAKVAILTDRGTVHIHDVPGNFLDWPARPISYHIPSDSRVFDQNAMALSGWGSALNAVSSGARTISATVRSNPLARFSEINLAQAGAGAGAKGGKIVVAGISRSVEAASGTVSTIMSIGETRLHLPGVADKVLPGSARWWFMRDGDAIAVAGDGIVRVHKIEFKKEKKPGKKKYSVVGTRILELTIPYPKEKLDMTEWDVVNDGYDVIGDWARTNTNRILAGVTPTSGPLSYAEIETSSPYRTISRDHRVDYEVFSSDTCAHTGAWAFGQDIPTQPLNTIPFPAPMQYCDVALALGAHPDGNELTRLADQIEQDLPASDPIEEDTPASVFVSEPDPEPEPEPEPLVPTLPPASDLSDDWPATVNKKKKKKVKQGVHGDAILLEGQGPESRAVRRRKEKDDRDVQGKEDEDDLGKF